MIVVSDRISAFDIIIPNPVPDKGKILNQLSMFWFDYTRGIVKNYVVSINYDEFPGEFRIEEYKGRSMLVKKINMLPVECIVRGYITGSAWSEYVKTGCICGIQFPRGGLLVGGMFE